MTDTPQSDGHSYSDDGITVVRDLLPLNHLFDIEQAAYFLSAVPPGNEVDEYLVDLRDGDPSAFSRVYDSLTCSVVLHQTITTPVLARAGELLQAWPEELGVTGTMVRMDAPRDDRNSLDWHQEYRYYEQTWPENSLVVWFPVNDHEGLGGLEVAVGSHKYGLFDAEMTRTGSDQWKVPSETVAKFNWVKVDVVPGDVVFFHMHLLHRTGRNEGARVRLSGGYRLHKMSGTDWRHGRLVYRYA